MFNIINHQIKTTEIILSPLELLKLERLTILNVSKEIELLELLYIAGEKVKWYTPFAKLAVS